MTNNKLTEKQKQEIRKIYSNRSTITQLASKYKVHRVTIYRILKEKAK